MTLNIGINEEAKAKISKPLAKILAETYTLYLKTHKYHWNITGPMFRQFHMMFEEQYTDLAQAVDEIAERIRVLGPKAPGSYSEFSAISDVKEDSTLEVHSVEMLKNLLSDHETIIKTLKDTLPLLEGANDEGTNALLGARIEYHEKTAWMLKSSIE